MTSAGPAERRLDDKRSPKRRLKWGCVTAPNDVAGDRGDGPGRCRFSPPLRSGLSRAADRRGHGVEQERDSGGAALPIGTAEETCNRYVCNQGPRAKPGSTRYPAEVAPVFG